MTRYSAFYGSIALTLICLAGAFFLPWLLAPALLFAAFTGKAVHVMTQKGTPAQTVNERSKLTRLQHLILTRLSDDKAPRRAALI